MNTKGTMLEEAYDAGFEAGLKAPRASDTITLPVADVRQLCECNRDLIEHLKAIDTSATNSMYGVEYASKAWARVASQLPRS